MKKKLSLRLKQIISYIESKDKIIDIGSDHSYIPIFLLKNKIVKIADASDINKYSVEQSIRNIKKENLEDKINIFLSDGLEKINLKKYNTIIIAGLGSDKILKILNQEKINQKLILHSTNNLFKLRNGLEKLNYEIIDEELIIENNINNIIICAKKSKKKVHYSENEKYLGPILLKKSKKNKNIENYFLKESKKHLLIYKKSKKEKELEISKIYKNYLK